MERFGGVSASDLQEIGVAPPPAALVPIEIHWKDTGNQRLVQEL
jgi:hypothetical protein